MEKMEKIEETKVTKHRGWRAMPYVIGNETFEKLGTTGMLANMIVYLTTVFNMKQVDAAVFLNVFSGTTNLAPVFGAFLSDSYLGRYTTLAFACIISLMGMLLVTLTAAIPKMHPPFCTSPTRAQCIGPNPSQLGLLIGGFAFLVVGAGGIRACNLAFGADQFNPNSESGRRGINSFFNWYFFTFTSMMMVSLTVIVYVQVSVSWALGLGIPTVAMFFSCVFFFWGNKIYVKVRPEGSPFTSIARVFAVSVKKRTLKAVSCPDEELFDPPHTSSLNSKLHHTDQLRFLDKAAVQTAEDTLLDDGSPADPWKLCSAQQVEEAKCLIRVVPIWAACIVYYVALVQQSTYGVLQAMKMDRHIGRRFQIPAGSFGIFNMLTLTLWIPIYDRVVVLALRRVTKHDGGLTLLQRMGIGFGIGVISMVVAGLVEVKRRNRDVSYGEPPMSALWLIPQYAIAGLSEAFSIVGQVEFYYKQMPENMRSLAGSLLFLGMAAGNYLSGFMVSIVHKTTGHGSQANWLSEDLNHGRLDLFYYLIACCSVVNLVYFLVCAMWYRYKGQDEYSEKTLETEMKTKNLSPHV